MKRNARPLFYSALLSLLTQRGQVLASDPMTVNSVSVIVTTESHWIGVNTEALTGDVQKGSIGVNTELLTEIGGQTKWIGKNTQYITDIVQTTTVSGAPIAYTSFPNIKIVGPVDQDGTPTDAFDIIMAPALAAQVQQLADQHCPEDVNDNRKCSEDFAPRVQSLLKGGPDDVVLTERFVIIMVASAVALIATGIEHWLITSREQLIPEIIHVDRIHTGNDNDSHRAPIFTTIASNYVVTLTTLPKQTQATDANEPQSTLGNAQEAGDCWLYVGVDLEMNEDATSEASETSEDDGDDEPAKKRSLSDVDGFENGTKTSDGDTRKLSRGVAGRILVPGSEIQSISKRQDKGKGKGTGGNNNGGRSVSYINKIGKCNAPPVKDRIIRAQKHPGPSKVMGEFNLQNNGWDHGIDPQMWWFVPSQDFQSEDCPVAELVMKGKKDPNSDDISPMNFPVPYDQQTHLKSLNVDHIYELATIQQFFESELSDPNDPRCKDFVDMFSEMDTGLQAGKNPRFYSLWAQSSNPTPRNWAFAGLDERINNLKGALLNPKLEGWGKATAVDGDNADDHFDKLFQTWNNGALSLGYLNRQSVTDYFSQRNTAIHKAFIDFDSIQRCGKPKKAASELTSWSEAYKNFITDLLIKNEVLMQTRVQDLDDKISKEQSRLVDQNGQPNKYGKAYAKLKSRYPVSYFKFDHAALLQWPAKGKGTGLGIRDATPTDGCVVPEPTAACVERKVVNCYFEYEDRPDLTIDECPPTPVLPAYCADRTTEPLVPADPGYCVPQDDLHTCTFAISVRKGENPVNASIYDYRCNEIGKSNIGWAPTSINSQLPYTLDIQQFTIHSYRLELRFAYAGQVKEQLLEDPGNGQQVCETTNYTQGDDLYYVTSCPFDCSAKRA